MEELLLRNVHLCRIIVFEAGSSQKTRISLADSEVRSVYQTSPMRLLQFLSHFLSETTLVFALAEVCNWPMILVESSRDVYDQTL